MPLGLSAIKEFTPVNAHVTLVEEIPVYIILQLRVMYASIGVNASYSMLIKYTLFNILNVPFFFFVPDIKNRYGQRVKVNGLIKMFQL